MPDGLEKGQVWRELPISLLAPRRSELYAERLKIESHQISCNQNAAKARVLMMPEEKTPRIKPILGVGDGYDRSKTPELTRPPEAQNRP
jgi:hypothetical protein